MTAAQVYRSASFGMEYQPSLSVYQRGGIAQTYLKLGMSFNFSRVQSGLKEVFPINDAKQYIHATNSKRHRVSV